MINKTVGNVKLSLPIDVIEKDLKRAHGLLNMQIVADCTPLIPFQQGALRGSVSYPQGLQGDEIEWNTPYAHYQYVGDLYLTPDGRSWAHRGEKKYPTGIPLKYRQGGSHWFDNAKDEHLDDWIEVVARCVR